MIDISFGRITGFFWKKTTLFFVVFLFLGFIFQVNDVFAYDNGDSFEVYDGDDSAYELKKRLFSDDSYPIIYTFDPFSNKNYLEDSSNFDDIFDVEFSDNRIETSNNILNLPFGFFLSSVDFQGNSFCLGDFLVKPGVVKEEDSGYISAVKIFDCTNFGFCKSFEGSNENEVNSARCVLNPYEIDYRKDLKGFSVVLEDFINDELDVSEILMKHSNNNNDFLINFYDSDSNDLLKYFYESADRFDIRPSDLASDKISNNYFTKGAIYSLNKSSNSVRVDYVDEDFCLNKGVLLERYYDLDSGEIKSEEVVCSQVDFSKAFLKSNIYDFHFFEDLDFTDVLYPSACYEGACVDADTSKAICEDLGFLWVSDSRKDDFSQFNGVISSGEDISFRINSSNCMGDDPFENDLNIVNDDNDYLFEKSSELTEIDFFSDLYNQEGISLLLNLSHFDFLRPNYKLSFSSRPNVINALNDANYNQNDEGIAKGLMPLINNGFYPIFTDFIKSNYLVQEGLIEDFVYSKDFHRCAGNSPFLIMVGSGSVSFNDAFETSLPFLKVFDCSQVGYCDKGRCIVDFNNREIKTPSDFDSLSKNLNGLLDWNLLNNVASIYGGLEDSSAPDNGLLYSKNTNFDLLKKFNFVDETNKLTDGFILELDTKINKVKSGYKQNSEDCLSFSDSDECFETDMIFFDSCLATDKNILSEVYVADNLIRKKEVRCDSLSLGTEFDFFSSDGNGKSIIFSNYNPSTCYSGRCVDPDESEEICTFDYRDWNGNKNIQKSSRSNYEYTIDSSSCFGDDDIEQELCEKGSILDRDNDGFIGCSDSDCFGSRGCSFEGDSLLLDGAYLLKKTSKDFESPLGSFVEQNYLFRFVIN